MNKLLIPANNLPLMSDTLSNEEGVVDLTGCTVQLVFQLAPAGTSYTRAATVADAVNGGVSYQFVTGDTAVIGCYLAQWTVTDGGGGVRSYPSCPFPFEIVTSLPAPPEVSFTRLSDLFDDVRALTGDFKKNLYEDSAIASVMKTVLRLGRVKVDGFGHRCHGHAKRWTVGADGLSISPAILPTDVLAYSLLVYHTAKILITPNIAAYSYRTRALSERFGESRDFLAEMDNIIYQLEDGEQTYGTISGLRASFFALNGIFAWSLEYAVNSIELSFL